MNTIALCLLLACWTQSWDRPTIQEAELSPPNTQQDYNTNTSGDTESWDMDSPSREGSDDLPPLLKAPTQRVYWTYDEEGRPVSHPVEGEPRPQPSVPEDVDVPVQEEAQETREADKAAAAPAGRVAIFWMIMPPR